MIFVREDGDGDGDGMCRADMGLSEDGFREDKEAVLQEMT